MSLEEVRKKWAEKAISSPPPSSNLDQNLLEEKKKAILKIINWELNDDKHRKLEQILDTVDCLIKIFKNIIDSPSAEKFRRIRITNKAFGAHVRDAPGGESIMLAAGWRPTVEEFEKYFRFDGQPGTLEWSVFEEAYKELKKLDELIAGKISRNEGGSLAKKKEAEERREIARLQIEEDKQDRHSKFTYSISQ